MAVLTYSEAAQVKRVTCKQRRVPSALILGIGGVAVQIMGAARRDPLGHTLTDVALEAGGMVGTDPDVLVHVEYLDPAPVKAVQAYEDVEETELGIASGEHHVGLPAAGDRGTNQPGGVTRCGRSHLS